MACLTRSRRPGKTRASHGKGGSNENARRGRGALLLACNGSARDADDPADLRANNEAALYVLTEALVSGKPVHLTVNGCNPCYAHLTAK
jgi:hypothetical protein